MRKETQPLLDPAALPRQPGLLDRLVEPVIRWLEAWWLVLLIIIVALLVIGIETCLSWMEVVGVGSITSVFLYLARLESK
jgi:hypothetical protein